MDKSELSKYWANKVYCNGAKTLLKKVAFAVAGTIFVISAILVNTCGIYTINNEGNKFEYNSSKYTRTIKSISYDKEIPDTTFVITKIHEKEN